MCPHNSIYSPLSPGTDSVLCCSSTVDRQKLRLPLTCNVTSYTHNTHTDHSNSNSHSVSYMPPDDYIIITTRDVLWWGLRFATRLKKKTGWIRGIYYMQRERVAEEDARRWRQSKILVILILVGKYSEAQVEIDFNCPHWIPSLHMGCGFKLPSFRHLFAHHFSLAIIFCPPLLRFDEILIAAESLWTFVFPWLSDKW